MNSLTAESRLRYFLFTVAILLCSVSLLRADNAPSNDSIAKLKPGEWLEVPDSQLEKVAASPRKFTWLRGGIYAECACWAGGAFDTQRDRLYLGPGGGHAGYNGNEIYAFDLNDLKWHRLNDPDPVIPGTEYTDLNKAPFAMHTYDGVAYLPPPVDRYVVVGGWNTPLTYALDPDHPEHWEVYPGHGHGRTGDICGYDPIDGLLWFNTPSNAGKMSQWNPLTHVWTRRTNESPHPSYYETADVDYCRRLLVSCGKGLVKTWKLDHIPAPIVGTEIETTGDTDILKASSPGFCYVPLMDKFVGWANGPDVYTLDIDAKKWTKHPPAASNTVIPGPADQWGTFGRFRYVPSKNVFVLYNATKQNVFIYRLTADKPNIIAGVEASLKVKDVPTDLPTAAISVRAVYADGSKKDVTGQASFFSNDPALARVDVHGKGILTGLSAGTAHIRAVYSDPAFGRGFGAEVAVPVRSILADSTLDAIHVDYPKLTIVAGDSFPLHATRLYTHGTDRFEKPAGDETTWASENNDVASITKGTVTAHHAGGPIKLTASFNGKSEAVLLTVVDRPAIKRVSFGVKPTSPRDGWLAENGQKFTPERGYGWLDARDVTLRDDRKSAHHLLRQSFNAVKEKQYRVQVPAGRYSVRVSMGDADYGAVPFADGVSVGKDKLLAYEGHENDVATGVVEADANGLVFTVNGPINYLVIAPVGVDLQKYSDDGP